MAQDNFVEWSKVRLTLAVTNACNLVCKHCYIEAESSRSVNELSPSEYGGMADEMIRLSGSATDFFVTGGEPLLREDLMDILSVLGQRGKHLHLTTNGLLLTPVLAQGLADLKVVVAVSLDGSTSNMHELIRGSGTFSPAVSAIRLLVDHGVEVTIDSVVHQKNFPHLSQLFHLAVELEVNELVLTNLVVIGRACKNRDLLQPVNLFSLYIAVEQICQAEPAFKQLGKDNLDAWVPQRCGKANCGAGCHMIYIAPNGDVYPCSNLTRPQFRVGNLRETSLAKMWDDNWILNRIRTFAPTEELAICQTCTYQHQCSGGCLAEMGYDLSSPHPQCPSFCKIFAKILREGGNVNEAH